MKFKCQNCSNKFNEDIKSRIQRGKIKCPKCKSKITRFAGSGDWSEEQLEEQSLDEEEENEKEYQFHCKKCNHQFNKKIVLEGDTCWAIWKKRRNLRCPKCKSLVFHIWHSLAGEV